MNDIMYSKIKDAEYSYDKLSAEMSEGKKVSVEKLKELKHLQKIIDLYFSYQKAEAELIELKSLISETIDSAFKNDLEKELPVVIDKKEKLDQELYYELIDKDPDDSCNAIFEISGEVGGEEANLFARDLYDMYIRYIEGQLGYKVDLLSAQETDLGGYNYVAFRVVGDDAYGKFKFESGIHRVQRVPKTEAKGRLHTSTASVMVTPEITAEEFKINENDIEFVACHSSGAGGQNVNKVSSAIRATYKPTGLTVFCQSSRDQWQNKITATQMIASKLKAEQDEKNKKESVANRASKLGTRDRSEKLEPIIFLRIG